MRNIPGCLAIVAVACLILGLVALRWACKETGGDAGAAFFDGSAFLCFGLACAFAAHRLAHDKAES